MLELVDAERGDGLLGERRGPDGGPTVFANLALACVSCLLRKGARTDATDPQSGEPTKLFDPRTDTWEDHFLVTDALLDGCRSARSV